MDTRVILSCVCIANERAEFVPLERDNRKSNKMPNLLIGGQKILGGVTSQLTFLCMSNKKIGAKLYAPDSQQSIMKHLNYFERQMRPCTYNLIQALLLDQRNKREQQA